MLLLPATCSFSSRPHEKEGQMAPTLLRGHLRLLTGQGFQSPGLSICAAAVQSHRTCVPATAVDPMFLFVVPQH